MTESTSPKKGKVQKLGSRSTKKRSAGKKRAQTLKQSTNSIDPALLDQLGRRLLNCVLNNESSNESQNSLSKYVAFTSRGKSIGTKTLNQEHRVSLLCQAISNGVCVSGRYNRRERLLQPYGIVIREPKIYLLAVEQVNTSHNSDGASAPVIKKYLSNRFEHLTLSDKPYSIPANFDLQDYIAQGSLEQSVVSLESSLPKPFELVLRLHNTHKDNLVRDLEDLPLSKKQTLIQENKNGTYQLNVPDQRATHELLEWILGRQERVEVMEPESLRQYVIGRLHAIANRYMDTDQIPLFKNSSQTNSTTKSQKTTKDENIVFPTRSKYSTNDTKNTVVTWMVVRLLLDQRITDALLSNPKLGRVENVLPDAMCKNIGNLAVRPFETAAKKILAGQKEPTYDPTDPFTKNTEELAQLLVLNEIELAILRVSALINAISTLRSAEDLIRLETNNQTTHNLIALLSGQKVESIEYYLRNDNTLRRSRLIVSSQMPAGSAKDIVKMNKRIVSSLFQEQPENGSLLGALLKQSDSAQTTESDLEHLSNHITNISRLIKGSADNGSQGTNILLWGAPGTGKTQIARYLGQSLGLGTYEVPTTTSDRRALSEIERFSTYQFNQSLLAQNRQAILIFDEVENIICAPFSNTEELPKAYINQVLEENPIPAIWISNKVGSADAAYLRRFEYAVEIKTPDINVKRRMASRILGGLPITGQLLDDFLERQEVGPALLTKLKRVADTSGLQNQEAIDKLALSIVEGDLAALGAPALVRDINSATNAISTMPYDPTMINTDINVENFADQLQTGINVRLCLYGPPGTGKTAWAKNLSKDLDRPAHVKQISDIKNKFVGESENAVASAFKEAAKENAVLIFDEVESYLHDRQATNVKHESDLVNQFLTSMESHNGIVVCSTNFIKAIDSAALRRFDYKIKFDYLREDQANSLLLILAELSNIDIDLETLRHNNLTLPKGILAPGDFAAVLRRSQSTTHEMTIEEIHAALLAEADFRSPKTQSRIGFV